MSEEADYQIMLFLLNDHKHIKRDSVALHQHETAYERLTRTGIFAGVPLNE